MLGDTNEICFPLVPTDSTVPQSPVRADSSARKRNSIASQSRRTQEPRVPAWRDREHLSGNG